MQEIDYGNEVLEFPDSMSMADIESALEELPEEKISEKELPSADRYKAGMALKRISPSVAGEVRRMAMERRYGFFANDPPSFENFVKNIDIPEYVEELASGLSSIIAGTGLFTYRFGRNVMQDGNEAMIQKGHPILPGMGPRVQKQVKPVTDFAQAIHHDWKAVLKEILPVEKVKRQGFWNTMGYYAQDNPIDTLLLGFIFKKLAMKGTRLSLRKVQRIISKSNKTAKTLDSVLSTKRTPIIYNLGPEKKLARISAKIQKETATMLKPTSDIGGLTLDEVATLAASDPTKAVRHIRRAKVPYNKILEGLRNKGAKVVMSAKKTERTEVAKNLQLVIDRVEKIGTRTSRKSLLIEKQATITRKMGSSTFNAQGNLIGTDNYTVSIFPEYSKTIKGKPTKKQLIGFYVKNEELLLKYPELAVSTWYKEGQTYIDLSVMIPTSNKFAAIGLGRRYNQKAIFNLKTLEETQTGETGLGIGDLPSIEQRMKDIRRTSPPKLEPKTGIAELRHWSTKEGLTEIDPAKYGTGLKRTEAERKIADPANWIDRSHYGIKDSGYVPEAGLGTVKYEVDIPYKNLYDFMGDPLKLKTTTSKEKWDITKKERRWIVDVETKKTLSSATGKADRVDIEIPPNKKIIDIHTHPDEAMPSDYDWGRFGWSDVKEMRVLTPKGKVYELKKPNNFKLTPRQLREKHNAIENEIFESGRSQKMSVDEILENINSRLAKETGIIFKTKKLKDYKDEEWTSEILEKSIKKEQGNPISLYEKAIKNKGYKGYYANSPLRGNTAVLFEKMVPKAKPGPGEKLVTFERTYSEDLFTKYIFEKTFDAALEKFPTMKTALAEHKAKKLINTLRNLSDEANFNERAKMHEEIYKQIDRLSKEEQAIIVPYLEGRAQLINESSEQFKSFEIWYRKLINEHEAHLWKMGKLPESRTRLYQPLAKATGQTVEQVEAELGTFTPVYVHHMFPTMFDEKMGIHFAETTGKRFRPGFMKKCQGVQGYSENFKEILPKYTSEYIKFKHTETFIRNFTEKFGIKANLKDIKVVKGGLQLNDKMYPGYKIVAPDGFLSYYRGKIDLQKEILKRMEDTTFDEAVGDILAGITLPIKKYMGVSKNKVVYLVPEKMVGELESFATPVFGSQKAQDVVRLVIDKPTQVWKDSVLAVSPRWIKNNVMGDIIFNTFEGVGPLSYSRAFRTIYKDCIPDELLKASFANVMKYNPKLGKTAKTVIGGYVKALGETKVVKGAAYVKDMGYALNTMFEQPFVRALYVKLAREQAVRFLKTSKTPRTEVNILARMRVIKNDELLVRPLVDKVHEILPVFNLLGNFERKYIRRFVPFVNWYKFMVRYGVKLPAEHPFKLVGARGLGALSEEHRERVFSEYFPFMAREIDSAGIPTRFDHLWPIGQKGEQMAKFFNVRGANPFTTIEDFVNLDFMNMASPIITVPIEQVTGRAIFGNRKFESGEAGITVTHKGVEYKEFAKVRPPLVDHVLSQFPQYGLLKKWLVPARQWDSGTILNPDPILNPDTGEYVYPIESLEKILNMLGVDQKTLNVQKMWYRYQTRKAQTMGRALTKHRENLSFQDIRDIVNEIQQDAELWKKLRTEMDEKAHYEEEKTREFLEKVR